VALTKDHIISEVFERTQLPKSRSREVVETTLELIKNSLADSEDLLISGFGKFLVKDKRARRGRNPQTKADMKLRARKVVVFKTSGVLRKHLNGEEDLPEQQ